MLKECPQCKTENESLAKFCSECGLNIAHLYRPQPEEDKNIGKIIAGRYRIIEKIGSGGMGRIYKAEQKAFSRLVAIKMLFHQKSHTSEEIQRFHLEANAVSMLNHPNIITIYDFGETETGDLFIVMEYLDGVTLKQVIEKELLSPKRTLHIISQIAGSLFEAHAKNILHRDLKPSNVMLVERGELKDFVKVLDFGLAKFFHPGKRSDLTQSGMIYGSFYYMSPEQAQGEEVDFRTDIYSLGVIAYELLCGKVPFTGDTPAAILSHILTKPILPINHHVQVPNGIEDLILKALEKDKNKRFQTMKAFSDHILFLKELASRDRSWDMIDVSKLDRGPFTPGGTPKDAVRLIFADSRPVSAIDGFAPAEVDSQPVIREKVKAAPPVTDPGKDELIFSISHDIRSPLNGILGMATLLSETRLDKEQREYLDLLVTAANELLQTLVRLEGAQQKKIEQRSAGKRKLSVLLVENEVINQKLMKIILNVLGHEVEIAGNGKEAVASCQAHSFDLIFMDIQMPEMDGYEATALIRKKEGSRGTHTPIIALTALALKGDREKCLQAGMDDYLSKPIKLEDVAAIISRYYS